MPRIVPAARKSFSQSAALPKAAASFFSTAGNAASGFEPPRFSKYSEPPLELGVLGGGGGRDLAVLEQYREGVEKLVGVGHVALVEGEVVLEQGLREPCHAEELRVIFGRVRHGVPPVVVVVDRCFFNL
jgi:hypothetical protein